MFLNTSNMFSMLEFVTGQITFANPKLYDD